MGLNISFSNAVIDLKIQKTQTKLWKLLLSIEKIRALLQQFQNLPKNAFLFISIWIFFHEHSQITGLQGKGGGICLIPGYHFHPLHRHLDISWALTAEGSPLHIVSSQTRTENLWLPSASHQPLSYPHDYYRRYTRRNQYASMLCRLPTYQQR